MNRMRTFYKIMVRLQKRMHDKPKIRSARMVMLNTAWDKVINSLMNSTAKFHKIDKKGNIKGSN
jgi:hypothetical protein